MAQYISVKNTSSRKFAIAIITAICVLFLSFVFSFADDSGKCYYYEGLGSSDTPTKATVFNTGNVYMTYSTGVAYFASAFECHYAFYDNGTAVGIVLGVEEINGNKFFNAQIPDSEIQSNSISGNASVLNFSQYSNGYYFATTSRNKANGNTELSSWIEPYASVDDAVSALAYGIEFGFEDEGSFWSGSATVSVEAGCVAYILVDGGTATLTTTFPELSKLSRPLWTSGSTYSFENDLPSSGKVFSSTSGTLIDWLIPASAKTDLLGRSYQGGRPLSDLPSGQYLVVYNPVYRGYDDKGVGIMSPTIYVSLSNYGAVRQFRLTASYNGGLIESTSDDGYSSWFDSIGEEELDANGNPIYVEHLANGTTQTAISIPAGGGNIVINGDNADNSIGGLLDRLLSLLTAPIKYIERLYNSAIQFFDYLSSLWGWLPVEVTSIIGAALAVLVVIGVVKFLWK